MKKILNKWKEKVKYFDWMLFIPYIVLCCVGIVMVYSASSINLSYVGENTASYMIKQLLYVVLGIVLLFLFSHISTKVWTNKILLFCGAAFIGFLLFIAKYFTNSINGANGWIQLGAFSLQPSEFCKLFLVLFCSYVFANWYHRRQQDLKITNKFKPYFVIGLLLFLVLFEPDTGGFMINFAIVLIIYLTSRIPEDGWLYRKKGIRLSNTTVLLLWIATFIILLQVPRLPFIQKMGDKFYQIARFTAFYAPFKHAQSTGRQLVNSYYAISNGGLFGLGLGNSIEKRGYLPEPYTDFILSVTTEELGVILTTCILLLLLFIMLRIFLIGVRANNLYDRLVCYGVGTFMFVESLFNIGAVIGLLPITGVTLPFISYGGSSMFVLSMALGLVMGISANQKRHLEKSPLDD